MFQELRGLDARLSVDGERLRINAPRGALSAALKARIAKHKEALIEFLHGAKASLEADSPVIPRVADDEPTPLSFAQERLWFLQQLAPKSPVYNLSRALRVDGPLQVDALEASFNRILGRHEALRTMFVEGAGRPFQAIAKPRPLRLKPIDLSALSEAERETESARLLCEEARRPFGLTSGRLLRVRLLRRRADEHILFLAAHHIVFDAWSMGVLLHELWSLYQGFVDGKAPSLPMLAVRYRDYAAWQRAQLGGDAMAADLAFWRRQLDGTARLDLSTDRPRPRRQSFRGARQEVFVMKSVTASLNELSRREGVTLFMTLLAAFRVLLYRYTGQEDMVIGAPAANRERTDLEGIIGFFVNTLPLRADLAGRPSFKKLLYRARRMCLDAYARQTAPFEKIVEALNPRRELDQTPFFQTMFVLQNTPRRFSEPRGLRLQTIEIDNRTAQFELSLYLRERDGELRGFFEYAADLFESSTIERMARHFQTLLASIGADPEQSIGALSMLSSAEQRQLLVEWNDTAAEYSKDACIHELFEAQVARMPDAVALEFAGQARSYRELDDDANRLARELRALGAGPGTIVGVLLEPSVEMVASLLAILKTGGAYLPLDPGYPAQRLNFMLADAEAKIVLTQKEFAPLIAVSAKILFIDQRRRGASLPPRKFTNDARADSPAYVIYTSGSTGTPKGVVGTHRGAVNRFSWMWKTFPFGPDEKSCQKTSLSFVDSIWEIFGAMLQGIPTVLVPGAVSKEPASLVDYLARHGVTRLVLVPSLLREILQSADLAERLAGLRYCFFSGEPLGADLAARFRRALPDCKLINLYGSSEVAADVTFYEIEEDNFRATVPIGRPIDNTQIYLLDSELQPVPVGARGEIYVGGDSLARGYLKRDELTAEKFIANPFAQNGQARLFRTGDMARYCADGNIEFLGRADDQVKIRGCRVELCEIESALNQHPGIGESAVVVHELFAVAPNGSEDFAGKFERQLTAYVVAKKITPPAVSELRAFLRQRLPDYMVPANFVRLGGLPRLPNGKIDRRALPLHGEFRRSEEGTAIAPRTEIETLIAQIWQEVLRVDGIGVDDNFFDRGGHSLLAAQVTAKMRAVFNKPVMLRDLFEAPTVAGLAALAQKAARTDQEKDLPAIVPASGKRVVGLAFGQKQLFLFSQLFGGADFLNMPYAYGLTGRLDFPALKKAVQEIVDRHEILRTAFIDTADGARPVVRRRLMVRLPIVNLARLPKDRRHKQLDELSKRDAARSFDLEQPPLFRMTLIRLADDQSIFLVTMHHIISDQWSMGVFRRELAALYSAFSKGSRSPLPPLLFQFSDFIHWQKQLLESGAFGRQVAYWQKRLDGLSPALQFRRDAKRKSSPRFHSARQPVRFDNKLVAQIKSFAGVHSCTPFMIFVAGLDILLWSYTGESDIRIGTLVANREQAGTDGMIGYFVNALVLRTRVLPAMTCAELLSGVRETCLDAYVHQDVPFEHLEALLEQKRKRALAPIYQVMFNYRNLWTAPAKANSLAIASWNGKNRADDPGVAMARLDLNFNLRELSTELTGAVTYKTDLFDHGRIAKLLVDYSAILEQIVDFPKRRISKIAVRGVGERD